MSQQNQKQWKHGLFFKHKSVCVRACVLNCVTRKYNPYRERFDEKNKTRFYVLWDRDKTIEYEYNEWTRNNVTEMVGVEGSLSIRAPNRTVQ